MIDVTKPLELVDGTPATLQGVDRDGDLQVDCGPVFGSGRLFTPSGRHYFGELPNLRNVVEQAADEPFEFTDISVEVSRTYTFPNGTVSIDEPTKLYVAASGSHRLVDANGASHYVPAGWLHLTWTVKPGAPNFVR